MEEIRNYPIDNMFQEYPDVVNVKLLSEMLGGISMKSVYKLLNQNKIGHLKIGRSFLIPKYHVIQYLKKESNV
mgnify:CR=1 FL=1